MLVQPETRMQPTVLDKKTLVFRPRRRTHHNLDIMETAGLARGPVYARGTSIRSHCSEVNDQVANLPEEDGSRRPALVSVILVLVAVNHAHALEIRTGLQHGTRVWIANQLGEIVIDDRFGNDIRARRKKDQSRSRRRALTALGRGTVAIADCSVDSLRVVRLAVPCAYDQLLALVAGMRSMPLAP